jgi:hypothetical protein
MDVKFQSQERGAGIVLGCTSQGDCMRWLRGYPTDMSFDGEIYTNEGEEVRTRLRRKVMLDCGGMDDVCEWIFD